MGYQSEMLLEQREMASVASQRRQIKERQYFLEETQLGSRVGSKPLTDLEKELAQVLPFKKHKGKKLREVVKTDAKYIHFLCRKKKLSISAELGRIVEHNYHDQTGRTHFSWPWPKLVKERPQIEPKRTINDQLLWRLKYGKYKGREVWEILNVEPEFVLGLKITEEFKAFCKKVMTDAGLLKSWYEREVKNRRMGSFKSEWQALLPSEKKHFNPLFGGNAT